MKLISLLFILLLIVSLSECKKSKATQNENQENTNSEAIKQTQVKVNEIQKPEYPSFSRKNKHPNKENKEIVKFEFGFTPKNETLMECARRVLGQTAFASLLGSAGAAGVGSASFLGGLGFTSSGIGAGSFAAWVHSGIGLAKAGSVFSSLQSAGAIGAGIFGSAFVGVTLAGGGASAGAYLCYHCGCWLFQK